MNQSGTAIISKNARTRIGHKVSLESAIMEFGLTSCQIDVFANGLIHLAPKTHDTSLAGKQISTIACLAKDLRASVQAVWPTRHELRYWTVEVLLLIWEEDDLGVSKEVSELQHVFEDLYHYKVQAWAIPSTKPDKELKRRMLKFLENDGEGILLILYYAGHARKSPQLNEAPIWFAWAFLFSGRFWGILTSLQKSEYEVTISSIRRHPVTDGRS